MQPPGALGERERRVAAAPNRTLRFHPTRGGRVLPHSISPSVAPPRGKLKYDDIFNKFTELGLLRPRVGGDAWGPPRLHVPTSGRVASTLGLGSRRAWDRGAVH